MYSCFYCSPISSDIVNIDGFNENIHFIHCFIRSVFRLHFMKINEIINRITGLRIISYGYSILISGIYRDRGIMTNVFLLNIYTNCEVRTLFGKGIKERFQLTHMFK